MNRFLTALILASLSAMAVPIFQPDLKEAADNSSVLTQHSAFFLDTDLPVHTLSSSFSEISTLAGATSNFGIVPVIQSDKPINPRGGNGFGSFDQLGAALAGNPSIIVRRPVPETVNTAYLLFSSTLLTFALVKGFGRSNRHI